MTFLYVKVNLLVSIVNICKVSLPCKCSIIIGVTPGAEIMGTS